MQVNKEQARYFAQAIFNSIAEYIQGNIEKFEQYLKEENTAEQLGKGVN